MKRLLLTILALCLSATIGHAATFNIAAGDIAGLKAAINTANATAGPHTINLAAGGNYTLSTVDNNGNGFFGPTGLPVITGQITIIGNGATIQRNGATGTPGFRILLILQQGSLTLETVTIAGGQTVAAGGFVAAGGGAANAGNTLLIRRSTVTRNFGNDGGGIANFGGNLILENSTVSNNTANVSYGGGGILHANFYGSGAVPSMKTTISFSTIFENRAEGSSFPGRGDSIADAFGPAGSIVVKNSIIASPTRGLGSACYLSNAVSFGHNVIGDASCGLTGPGDLSNTNPLLGPTVNNGGPTPTSNLAPGSPAFNAVPLADCSNAFGAPVTIDQRGVTRPLSTTCDSGAVETNLLFTYPVPAPVATPGAVTLSSSNVRITTPSMMLGGFGNPRTHSWFVKPDNSGSLSVTLQAGTENCCWDGSQLQGGGTISGTLVRFGDPTVLATLNATQPTLSPPAAYDSKTITANPAFLYLVTLTVPAPVPGGPVVTDYILRFDGASEVLTGGGPAVFGGLASIDEGMRFVMNVNPDEALNFTVLPGGPTNFFGAPNVLKNTHVLVFDPSHVRRLEQTMALGGSTLTIPGAGITPGPWTVVVIQPSHCQPGVECTPETVDLTDPTLRAPYRVLKGSFNFSTNSIIPGSDGLDFGVYAAWFTSGDGRLSYRIDAPASIHSVELTISQDICTGYDFTAPTCSLTTTFPTNETLESDTAGVGQLHTTIIAPAGTIVDVPNIDLPFVSDVLTTVLVRIRDVAPPVLTVPGDMTLEASGPSGAVATFSASATDQIDGAVPATCASSSGLTSGSVFPVGTTTVDCQASDSSGNTAHGMFNVMVQDAAAPVITSLTPSTASLWPPNHKMVPVTLTAAASDVVGVVSLKVISVTSNEPDNGLGDGDTANDTQITGPLSVNLRAERSGGGNGRTYTITVEARDAAGNASTRSTTVSVKK